MLFQRTQKFKKRWLAMINRKDFTTTASRKVCSLYLAGGKKNYLNNVPTIVPKTLKPIKRTPRRILNRKGVLRRLLPYVQIPDNLTKFLETETESGLTREAILQQQINDLQKHVNELNTELSCKNKELLDTKVMQKQNFCIDRFKHNTF